MIWSLGVLFLHLRLLLLMESIGAVLFMSDRRRRAYPSVRPRPPCLHCWLLSSSAGMNQVPASSSWEPTLRKYRPLSGWIPKCHMGVSLMCHPRPHYWKLVGISFLAAMMVSDSSPRISCDSLLEAEYLSGRTIRGLCGLHRFLSPYPSPPNTSSYVSYWDFPVFCTVIPLLCRHGILALVRGLPSDPPHDSSRTSHGLSANPYRPIGGCIRDVHPKRGVLPRAQKAESVPCRFRFFRRFPSVCFFSGFQRLAPFPPGFLHPGLFGYAFPSVRSICPRPWSR